MYGGVGVLPAVELDEPLSGCLKGKAMTIDRVGRMTVTRGPAAGLVVIGHLVETTARRVFDTSVKGLTRAVEEMAR